MNTQAKNTTIVFVSKTKKRGRPPTAQGAMTQKKKFYREGNALPKCLNEGCNRDVQVREWKYWSFRSECGTCMNARKRGKKLKGITFHKKDYCENHDGQLGFMCPVKKKAWKTDDFSASLDLDHLDGDHHNNSRENIKTYCKLCHMRKSVRNGDCSSHKKSARVVDDD